MSASLVGSEMCIRDSHRMSSGEWSRNQQSPYPRRLSSTGPPSATGNNTCLLYTSDAADDM
eukprot:8862133-Alexandrium_andersonii.AAC.1